MQTPEELTYQTCHVPGGDINQIPDMLRCMLEEKARRDVNLAPTMCYKFCFESSFRVISQQCADSMSLLRVSCPQWLKTLLSLPDAKEDRAKWRSFTVKQIKSVEWLWDSHLHLACNVFQALYISPPCHWQRCVHVCACMWVRVFVVAFLSRKGQHKVSCFSYILFFVSRATDRAALDIPIILLSKDVFFGMTRHRKSPKLCLSCSLMLSSLMIWSHKMVYALFFSFVSWMDATLMISHCCFGGRLVLLQNQLLILTFLTCSMTFSATLAQKKSPWLLSKRRRG